MKICARCQREKPDSDYIGRYGARIRAYCEQCAEYNRNAMKAWRKRNPELDRARHTKYVEENREKLRQYDASLRIGNEEKYRKAARDWQKENLDKVYATNAKWRAARLEATPKWLTAAQYAEMQEFYTYINDNPGLHVDHIVPLQGKNVCGLHVPWNLQILTAEDNMRKGNRFNGDI